MSDPTFADVASKTVDHITEGVKAISAAAQKVAPHEAITVFHCGKRPNLGTCETCGRSAAGTCQFKVKRRGEAETSACGRRFCANCQMAMPVVGPCCLAHARFLGASA